MFYYSYQHDSSRVKEVDCMNDLFCAAEQVKNINYVSSPFSLFPYPRPLSTPSTQAIKLAVNISLIKKC